MPIQQVESEGLSVPVKIWTKNIEAEALAQVRNTAMLPFVFKHVAIMPDVHAGKGATIGSVVATKNAIVPACVGVDIGCGMLAARLDISKDRVLDRLGLLRKEIESVVPVGFDQNKYVAGSVAQWNGWGFELSTKDDALSSKAMKQMGTLGGGNHFIEVCLDKNDNVWIMLHSGSRNVGKVTAERHIDKAKKIMEQYFIKLKDPDLAFLSKGTIEFEEYWRDLIWCQDYAAANRKEMLDRILGAMTVLFTSAEGRAVTPVETVHCHHNYVALENHFGENVYVTRKGAVRARQGDMGIIPGSMGTRSFIVEGLGNEESFCSCSHGAGRRMSRTKARATFSQKDLAEQTNGVECRKDPAVIDEIPGAYKDIDQVMKDQDDLVKIRYELKQVMCIKG